jgi:hypothetical protein
LLTIAVSLSSIAGKKSWYAIHDGLFAGRNVYRALRTVSWVSLKAGWKIQGGLATGKRPTLWKNSLQLRRTPTTVSRIWPSSGDVLSLQHVIRELRGRIRKIPGVPCMYVSGYRYTVERMPEALGVWDNTTMWCRSTKSVDY